MKKTYEAPVVSLMTFSLNQNVASCEIPTSYDAVSVDCLIKSGDVDGVFYDDNSDICSYYATSANLITLNGWTYLYWYGAASGTPEAGGTYDNGVMYGNVLMNALTSAGITSNPMSSNGALHAGLASTDVIQLINSSL